MQRVEADEAVVEHVDFVGLACITGAPWRMFQDSGSGPTDAAAGRRRRHVLAGHEVRLDAESQRLRHVGRAAQPAQRRLLAVPGNALGHQHRPGATPHTRTLSRPHARARLLTRWICAALAAPCAANLGHGWSPATSVIATITPPPAAAHHPVRRLGREHEALGRRVERRVPQRLVDLLGRVARLEPARGQWHVDVEAAQLAGRRPRPSPPSRAGSAASAGRRADRHAQRLDLGGGALGRGRRAVVADADVRAAVGEVKRERPARRGGRRRPPAHSSPSASQAEESARGTSWRGMLVGT